MPHSFAINGFGRIGRTILRTLQARTDATWVCSGINTLYQDSADLAYLLQYDSVHGRFPGTVEAKDNALIVNGHTIPLTKHRAPKDCDWQGTDVVFECTGLFTDGHAARAHLAAGAKKVLISAPGKNVDATIVYGVNHHILKASDTCVSNASCTTNCLAPLIAPLHDAFGVEHGIMTTVHAITGDQAIIDMQHKDPRRGRLAYRSIIPTSTGAAAAIGLVIPELAGKLTGYALRVPTDNVSLVDCTLTLKTPATIDAIHATLRQAADGPLKGVLAINDAPLVSIDFNQHPASSIVDTTQTKVMGSLIQLVAWYDNEWGFSGRMLDTATAMVTA